MQSIGKARMIEPKPGYEKPYTRKTVETMTNVEIRHKLCRDVTGGCLGCGVLDACRYGQEAQKRGLL